MFGRSKAKLDDNLGVDLGLPPGALARVVKQPQTAAYRERAKIFTQLLGPAEKLINVYNTADGCVLLTNTHIYIGTAEPLRTVKYPHTAFSGWRRREGHLLMGHMNGVYPDRDETIRNQVLSMIFFSTPEEHVAFTAQFQAAWVKDTGKPWIKEVFDSGDFIPEIEFEDDSPSARGTEPGRPHYRPKH